MFFIPKISYPILMKPNENFCLEKKEKKLVILSKLMLFFLTHGPQVSCVKVLGIDFNNT